MSVACAAIIVAAAFSFIIASFGWLCCASTPRIPSFAIIALGSIALVITSLFIYCGISSNIPSQVISVSFCKMLVTNFTFYVSLFPKNIIFIFIG
jgi:hypothetical protein